MTTIKLSDKESVTVSPKNGQIELHMIQGFLAMSKRVSVQHGRALARAITEACDQLTGCPPCNGNCNQGRDCPARATA